MYSNEVPVLSPPLRMLTPFPAARSHCFHHCPCRRSTRRKSTTSPEAGHVSTSGPNPSEASRQAQTRPPPPISTRCVPPGRDATHFGTTIALAPEPPRPNRMSTAAGRLAASVQAPSFLLKRIVNFITYRREMPCFGALLYMRFEFVGSTKVLMVNSSPGFNFSRSTLVFCSIIPCP